MVRNLQCGAESRAEPFCFSSNGRVLVAKSNSMSPPIKGSSLLHKVRLFHLIHFPSSLSPAVGRFRQECYAKVIVSGIFFYFVQLLIRWTIDRNGKWKKTVKLPPHKQIRCRKWVLWQVQIFHPLVSMRVDRSASFNGVWTELNVVCFIDRQFE